MILFFKILLLSYWSLFFIPKNPPDEVVRVIIMNDLKSRPIATNESFFWSNKKSHDEIEMKGAGINSIILDRLTKLSKQKENYDFPIASAVIINNRDTLYADVFFRNWRRQQVCYFDSSGDLRKIFGNFALIQHQKK
jgi:hypothetical protein